MLRTIMPVQDANKRRVCQQRMSVAAPDSVPAGEGDDETGESMVMPGCNDTIPSNYRLYCFLAGYAVHDMTTE